MLEQLFGSKARVALLRLFLNNPDKFYYGRAIARDLKLHLNSVRRELENLSALGIIISRNKNDWERETERKLKDNKKYYKLNGDFIFLEELRSLLVKSQIILEQSLLERIEKIGSVFFVLLSGIFVGRVDAPADILIVGNVDRRRGLKLIRSFEKEMGRPINYTILSKQDFLYRRGLTDKFLYDLLEHKNYIMVDKLKINKQSPGANGAASQK